MTLIRRYTEATKNFAVNRPWTTAILALVLAGGFWWYYSSTHQETQIESAVVQRGTVAQVVSVTGKVKPATEVTLSFERSGRIAFVYRDVGDRVYTGDPIVALDNGDISAQLAQAQAQAKAEEAKLEELKNGPRPEDLFVSEVAVSNATNSVMNDLKSAYVNADDAIRNKVDQLFSNPRSSSPQFNFVIGDSKLKSAIEDGRLSMEATLTSWNASTAGVSEGSDLSPSVNEAKNDLRAVQDYLDTVAMAVNALSTNSSLSQTTLDGYKAAILAGRTNVTDALGTLSTSEQELRTAQADLALKKAGSVQQKIDAQEAALEAADANVKNLQVQLAKTIIRSPLNGIVTKQDAKAGEIASVGTPLVSVISNAKYEIEANIPEADIAKIKVGDTAQVTLDAYGSDVVFEASVSKIDPAETVIDGVSTYRTTLQFKESDQRIKPGMTANTDIAGEKREGVLYVPGRAVFTKGATKTVQLIEGGIVREVEITAGLRGSNGDVEIISGLKEGDKIKTN